MPKTKLGNWAGALLAVLLVLFIALILGMNVARLKPGTPLAIALGICAAIAALFAEFGVRRVIRLAFRAFHRPFSLS